MNERPPDLKLRAKAFALRLIRIFPALPKTNPAAQVLGRQGLRSGTSVGANYRAASRGRSETEFLARTGDCLKEIEETGFLARTAQGQKLPRHRRACGPAP